MEQSRQGNGISNVASPTRCNLQSLPEEMKEEND